jgi:hypothetical protein
MSSRRHQALGQREARSIALLLCTLACAYGCNVILGYDEGSLRMLDGGLGGTAVGGTGPGGGGSAAGAAGSGGAISSGGSSSGGSAVTPTGIGGSGAAGGGQGTGGAGGGIVYTCDSQYGSIPGYHYCSATLTQCFFEADTTTTSCGSHCQTRGGICLSEGTGIGGCKAGVGVGCDSTVDTVTYCSCSRGCGNGPPCSSGQTCDGSSCS